MNLNKIDMIIFQHQLNSKNNDIAGYIMGSCTAILSSNGYGSETQEHFI